MNLPVKKSPNLLHVKTQNLASMQKSGWKFKTIVVRLHSKYVKSVSCEA